MADTLFDLYFSGKTTGEEELEQVRLKVGKIFGADNETLKRLFSGKPLRIKSGVDQDTAIRYRVALREAGALLDIRPQRTDAAEVSTKTGTQRSEELTLLPPNTGNLIDCAIAASPYPLPDITDIALAPAGVVIDESDPPPAQRINTEGLTLIEPNTGSLEDCKPVIEARPIPDITHINLAQNEPVSTFPDSRDT